MSRVVFVATTRDGLTSSGLIPRVSYHIGNPTRPSHSVALMRDLAVVCQLIFFPHLGRHAVHTV